MLLVPSLSWPQNGTSLPAKTDQRLPDLNLLQVRVEEFWQLLQQGRKQEATALVDPSSQEYFLKRQEPQFLSFKLRDMQFEEDTTSVLVTVTALRLFPQFPAPVEFPVQERYVFRDGTWYVQVAAADRQNPFASGPPAETPAPDAASILKTQKELERLEVRPEGFNLGEVGQGIAVKREISYHNASSIPISVRVPKMPPEFGFSQLWFDLGPGETKTNTIYINTQFLDGNIAADIPILLTSGKVEVQRVFKVEGLVKAPLSFAPYPLILDRNSPQTITVKNNTSNTVRISEVNPPDKFMTVEWRSESDRSLPGGGKTTFVVRWDPNKIPKGWTRGMIELLFDGSIGDRAGTAIPVKVK